MGRSLGPIIATGGIALFNTGIIAKHNDETMRKELQIVAATAVAASGLALVEHVSETLAVGIAWIALVGVLLVRLDPAKPSPIESFLGWYNQDDGAPTFRAGFEDHSSK